jgi:HTH-type transcriptional regulator / antitoxin HipB
VTWSGFLTDRLIEGLSVAETDSEQAEGRISSSVRTVADIGEVVQAVRRQQGLTQLDVGGLTGLGNRFMVDLEKGKPTIQMQKVLDVLSQLGLEVVIREKAG